MDMRDVDKHSEIGLRLLAYFILFGGVIAGLYCIAQAPLGGSLFDRALREMAVIQGLAVIFGAIFWSWIVFKFAGLIETARDIHFMVAANYVRPTDPIRKEPVLEIPTPQPSTAPATRSETQTREELIAKIRQERVEREARERALDEQFNKEK